MGKGDQKTRRGKLFSGSYGVLRPRKRKTSFSVVSPTRKSPVKTDEKPQAKIPEPKKEAKPIDETAPEAVVEKPKTEVGSPVEEAVIKEKKTVAKKPAAKKTETKPKKEDTEKGDLKEEAGDKE